MNASHSSLKTDLPLLAIFAGVVVLAYSNIYSNVFLYDDAFLIINNIFLQDSAYLPLLFEKNIGAGNYLVTGYYRPLQLLIYWVVNHLAGLQSAAFHVPNVILHIGNAYLLYGVGRKLNFQRLPLFFATLIWAVHPIHVESITYMSATADPLYSFFCLLGAYLLLPDFSPRRLAWASLCLVLALLSKEAAIAFPILAGSLLYFSSDNRFQWKTYLRLWPLVAIVVAYIVLRFIPHTDAPKGPPSSAIPPLALHGLSPYVGLPVYLRLTLWPFNLYMNHALSATGLLWLAQLFMGVAMALGSFFQVWKKQSYKTLPLSWALLWFFGAFFPVLHVGTIVYEHWMYLPLAGIFIGATETAFRKYEKYLSPQKSKFIAVASFFLIAGLGTLTWRQNRIWANPEIFYRNIFASGDPSPGAHINLGGYYSSKKDYAAAFEQYRLADEDIVRSKDFFTPNGKAVLFSNFAGTLFGSTDDPEKHKLALVSLEKALQIDPNLLIAIDKLAEYYEKQNDMERAQTYRKREAELKRQFGHYEGPPVFPEGATK